jgi:branched-chain amino acid transport system ATP-binding protein
MLRVAGLSAHYGRAHILADMNFEVPEGQVVVLLGRNGAGKSTTLKSIMGLTPPSRGSVVFDGQNLVGVPTHQIARKGVGWVPEERRIFPQLSVQENLRVSVLAHHVRDPQAALQGVYEMFPRLRERARQDGRSLSGGEQQMLALARALISGPRLLLIDEPTQGLAPNLVTGIAQSLLRIKGQGLSVLLVEQNARVALEIADRVYLIDHGVIQFGGSAAELQADQALQRQFLAV